jgi:nucleoside 2-deoxyribosyltransferase
MKPKAYLAGPITGLTFGECTDWREYTKKELDKAGIIGVSPMRAKEYLVSVGKITALCDHYDNPLSSNKGIVTRDRFDVRTCDVVLANFLGAKKSSPGTPIEFGWADAFDVPVVMVMEKEGNPFDHAMMDAIAGYRVETLDHAIDLIKAIFNYE